MLVRTGTALREGFEATGVALGAGEVTLDQARVIIRSVNDLPDDLSPGLIASAETLMIGQCSVFDPTRLALIGRRLAECVDPEGGAIIVAALDGLSAPSHRPPRPVRRTAVAQPSAATTRSSSCAAGSCKPGSCRRPAGSSRGS